MSPPVAGAALIAAASAELTVLKQVQRDV